MQKRKSHFLIGTRWFGVLGPCQLMIEELTAAGYDVFVFGQKDAHYSRYDNGQARLVEIRMARRYTAFVSDFLDVCKLIWYMIRYRPVGVHSFNPKPALLSFAAVSFFPKSKFFIGVTGLGNTFIRAKRIESLITFALRRAARRASFVFFQNRDDVALFQDKRIVAEDKIRMFIGPGVDLRLFRPELRVPSSDDAIVISCTARLIWQKGIREYIEAARLLKQKYGSDVKLRFKLLGEIDRDHPDCVDPAFVQAAVDDGTIVHISWTDNIVGELAETDIFVLHSYREGAPRAILEAAAMEIPTVGADAIGVRELVSDGETGFLTRLTKTEPMVIAISKLIDQPDLRAQMGKAARRNIAEPYSLMRASDAQMQMYRDVGYAIPALTDASETQA